MQTRNKLLDDLARLATNAAGMAQGVKEEAETVMRSRFERLLADLDLVQREEFEAVREMALKARAENQAQAKKIAALEKKLKAKSKG